ncbi:hypothetical protein HZB03_02210 [Candidatus Woesearchaeota archaeon]|nr:hypothetical protein [Candidatus Woesearchaeota archaeon]
MARYYPFGCKLVVITLLFFVFLSFLGCILKPPLARYREPLPIIVDEKPAEKKPAHENPASQQPVYVIPLKPVANISQVSKEPPVRILPPPATPPAGAMNEVTRRKQITEFMEWAVNHNIALVGVNESVDHFYYNGSKEGDFLDAREVPNILEVAEGLYKIPEPLLKVMRGKTFYLSHQSGRGYTVLGSWPEQNILVGVDRGSILEQTLNGRQAVHEFAHILDYHGIRGIYADLQNHFKELESQRKDVFTVPFAYNNTLPQPPVGYIDVYSTANDAENFAQHFTAYIFDAAEFRARAKTDALLKKKYDFFKDKLFDGHEY